MALSAVTNGRTRMLVSAVATGVAVLLSGCAGSGDTANVQKAQENQSVEANLVERGAALSSSQAALQAWAESGDVGAQYDLGLTLAESDPQAAGQWFERAALQGYGAAAYQMGLMQSDLKRAVEWHSMAAAMDHVGAQYELGDAYFNGRGTAKEPEWGMMWFERAARAGSAKAQHALGAAMAAGVAGSAQRREALTWLLIAQANGTSDDAGAIDSLKGRLNAAAVEQAVQQAQAWVKEMRPTDTVDRATVRFVQYALARLGYEPGYADGIDGERTYDAIVAFRGVESMGGGGIDGALLDRLRERLSARNR
ncbi:peptidoglycan-binding protein [Magnetovibrio sp.]|uniref:peptidoglycan-binding protein n=1 Tax=Magnetovibrio sp. TaxID=2024836 RepID=UPI002F946801